MMCPPAGTKNAYEIVAGMCTTSPAASGWRSPPSRRVPRYSPGPLPAWVPELTIELVTLEGTGVRTRLLEADRPEQILQQLRAR